MQLKRVDVALDETRKVLRIGDDACGDGCATRVRAAAQYREQGSVVLRLNRLRGSLVAIIQKQSMPGRVARSRRVCEKPEANEKADHQAAARRATMRLALA